MRRSVFLKAQVHILNMCTTETHTRGREHIHLSLHLLGYGALRADYIFFFLCGDLKPFVTAPNCIHPGYPIKEGNKYPIVKAF